MRIPDLASIGRLAKRGIVPAGLLVCGTVCALLLAEGAVRLFFDEGSRPRIVVDSGFGVRANRSNASVRLYAPDEYRVSVTTNSHGMRGGGREYALARPPGATRIALLGDSFIYGTGVSDQDVVSAALEDLWNSDHDAEPVEVLNFGISGSGQAEQFKTYLHKVRAFNPDHVILFYFSNDIGNNVVSNLFALDDEGALRSTGRDFLPGMKSRGILYGFGPLRWVLYRSHLWNVVRNRLSYLVQTRMLDDQGLTSYSDGDERSESLTIALLTDFVRQIESDGASPWIFIIPRKSGSSNFPMTIDEAAQIGATVIDGRSIFVRDDYFPKDSHWNPTGHRKAAEAIGRRLAEWGG